MNRFVYTDEDFVAMLQQPIRLKQLLIVKGSDKSGYFGHAGRPGQVGGSARSSGAPITAPKPYKGGPDMRDMNTVSLQALATGNYITTTPIAESPEAHLFLDSNLDNARPKMIEYDAQGNPIDPHQGILTTEYQRYPLWPNATWDERGEYKDRIVKDLAARTGLDEALVNDMIHQWAGTSNDEDLRSLSMQAAASEEFGVDMSIWQHYKYVNLKREYSNHQRSVSKFKNDKLKRLQEDRELAISGREYWENILNNPNAPETDKSWARSRKMFAEADDSYLEAIALDWAEGRAGSLLPGQKPLTTRANERKFLRAMYEATQEGFDKAGWAEDAEITVFRGVNVSSINVKPGTTLKYKGNAIESWSAGFPATFMFGSLRIAARVPRRNIIGCANTGYGCLTEGEYVIFGTIPDSKVYVVENLSWSNYGSQLGIVPTDTFPTGQ